MCCLLMASGGELRKRATAFLQQFAKAIPAGHQLVIFGVTPLEDRRAPSDYDNHKAAALRLVVGLRRRRRGPPQPPLSLAAIVTIVQVGRVHCTLQARPLPHSLRTTPTRPCLAARTGVVLGCRRGGSRCSCGDCSCGGFSSRMEQWWLLGSRLGRCQTSAPSMLPTAHVRVGKNGRLKGLVGWPPRVRAASARQLIDVLGLAARGA